jgi:hypothetical protein
MELSTESSVLLEVIPEFGIKSSLTRLQMAHTSRIPRQRFLVSGCTYTQVRLKQLTNRHKKRIPEKNPMTNDGFTA